MTRQVEISGWIFRAASGRNASHVCGWAPGSPISNVPDRFIDFPRGQRGMTDDKLRDFCREWLNLMGLLEKAECASHFGDMWS